MQGFSFKLRKNLAFEGGKMYQINNGKQLKLDFWLPFDGELDPNNRWVIMANEIPWDAFEQDYAKQFSSKDVGAEAIPFRVAMGALVIQKKLNLTDRETVDQIMENPYLQHFLGFDQYLTEKPFNAPTMVAFRRRISKDLINKINEEMFFKKKETKDNIKNKGVLVLDATCAPQDIRFPQDASLLNEAREKLEKIIDLICEKSGHLKPRTYRRKAHKVYLEYTKKRGGGNDSQRIRKIVKRLLQFVERDLRYVDELLPLLDDWELRILLGPLYENLDTIRKLAIQQREMIDENKRVVENRIVSISQPYVRPIIRGKARDKVEFGAKVHFVILNGYTSIDKISWDNFNEGKYLIEITEKYKEKYGYYPKAILADNIYKTKENKKYCKEHNIRFTGNKTYKEPVLKDKKSKALYTKDLKDRQVVEGKIGNSKRRHSLNLVMTKTEITSETFISMEAFVQNLEKMLKIKLAIIKESNK